ncbi:MAG: T9SS type A sorting domain-containing protein, partial [Bacteroidetes bacterium]|nr:T9SS type A sorting domain-containing protein [Bacteroidota bacterium]
TINSQTGSSVSLCVGQSMTFSVNATGTAPLSYQWYNGSGAIGGASGSNYTINSITTSDAGTYYCVVSNSCSPNATSNNIALTVLTAPSLTAQSADQTVCNGAAANFSVTASGSPSPSYQWYYNNSAISTATNNQYAISSASSANAGSYYCLVSNSCGTITSSSKLLTINTAPSITAQTSSSVSRCSGQNMTFSVTATGTAPLYYQWYNGNGAISGASGSTYTIASVSTAHAGTYYCVVSNICTPNATSNNIALTVFTAPSLTAQSTDQTVCSGAAANFSVSVSSSPASTYQWYKNASPIASAKNKQYLIGSVSTNNAGSYYCIATNSCGSVQSNAAILIVNTKPTVSSISDSTTECVGNSAVMNVAANGTNPLSYQWYQNLTPIQNATNSFHLISSVELSDQGNYYCVVTNSCGNDFSNSLQMLVNSPVQIISESGDSIQCENGAMSFEVITSGTTPINYQWYNDKGNILGETSNTYTINDLSVADAGNYYCEITNPCGSVYSLIKKLTVKKLPVISLGQDTVFCHGGSIVLSPGSGYFCLWNTGSINPEYEVTKRGDYYVQVTDKYGCQAYSDTVFVDVLEPFASEDICVVSGDPVTGKNLIAWERTQGQRTAYYNIYRETTATGVYEKIASRLFDSISVYVDYNSNPKQRAYRYRITAVDSCGNESDPSNHHKTIHLTVNQGVGNTNNLIWSHYEGFTFSSYLIYRGTHPDSLSQLDIIQSNLNSYTDINPPIGLLYYRVAVLMPDTCNPQIFRGQTSKGPFTQSMSNMKDYNSKQSDYMEAYPALISIDSNYGASGSLEVFTNLLEWDVKSSQGWLAVERDLTSKTITVTALETNNLDYARTAYVDITSDVLPAFTVTVMQKGGDNTISIADVNDTEGKLKVYPNPFSTETNFEIPAYESKIELLEIIDASGQIVFEEKDIVGNTYALRNMNLSKGLYFVRIVTDRIYSAKIMVK